MEYEELLREQVNEIREARNSLSDSRYVCAVDTLILLLQSDMKKVMQEYRDKQKLKANLEDYDKLFCFFLEQFFNDVF